MRAIFNQVNDSIHQMRSSQHNNQSSGVIGIILLIFIFCIMMMIHQTANASHMLGADLSYKHLSGQKYLVQYTLYRDCNGISAPSNMNLKASSANCDFSAFYSLELVPNSSKELNTLCPTVESTCNGGNIIGIQSYDYSCEVDIPFSCEDWKFSVTDCCRNSAITTINDPSSSTIYLEAFLNNTYGPNSLGTFKMSAATKLINGRNEIIDASAYDSEGDSLVYRLSTPRISAEQNVSFLSPYNQNKPLGAEMTINSATGEISVSPTHLLTGILSVEVLEFRNGIHIGTISREMQMNVVNSGNFIPELSGINGSTDFAVNVCKNSPLLFNIYSSDENSEQQLQLKLSGSMPDAKISIGTGKHPQAQITAGTNNLAAGVYKINIEVIDDACPYVASQTFTYTITILEVRLAVKTADVSCAGKNDGRIVSIVSGGSAPYSYQWADQNTNSAIRNNLSPANYTLLITDNEGCTATENAEIKTLYQSPVLNLGGTMSGCKGYPLQLSAGSDKYSYQWSNGSTESSIEVNSSGTYRVQVSNENGCSSSASVNVIFQECNGADRKFEAKERISMYPNPVKDIVKVKLENIFVESAGFSIRDIRGQLIERTKYLQDGISELSIDLSHLQSGVYILLVQTDTELVSLKFCKL
jgi:hypothetical protein